MSSKHYLPFGILIVFGLLTSCDEKDKEQKGVQPQHVFCVHTLVDHPKSLAYSIYLSDTLIGWGKSQNRVADSFKCFEVSGWTDNDSLRVVVEELGIDSTTVLYRDSCKVYIDFVPSGRDVMDGKFPPRTEVMFTNFKGK